MPLSYNREKDACPVEIAAKLAQNMGKEKERAHERPPTAAAIGVTVQLDAHSASTARQGYVMYPLRRTAEEQMPLYSTSVVAKDSLEELHEVFHP